MSVAKIQSLKPADTYSVVTHESGVSGLGSLAGGGRGRSSLVLGVSALVGSGLGGLRHGEGVQERLWEKEQRVGKVVRLEIGAYTPKYPMGLVLWDRAWMLGMVGFGLCLSNGCLQSHKNQNRKISEFPTTSMR